MIDHEVMYERNLTGSYMKIASSRNAKFDEKILLRRKLKGLLSIEQCFVNGEPWYWYHISGKQSLDTYCRIHPLQAEFVERLILSICDEIEILEWNLLDEKCLILDPEYIFINHTNEEVIFTVYPGNREEVPAQFRQLMEYVLTKLDHKDPEAVRSAYGLYEKIVDEEYGLTDLKEVILQKRQEKLAMEKRQEPEEFFGHASEPQPRPFKERTGGNGAQGASLTEEESGEEKPPLWRRIAALVLGTDEEMQESPGLTAVRELWNRVHERFSEQKHRLSPAKRKAGRAAEERRSRGYQAAKSRETGGGREESAIVYPTEEYETVRPQIHPTVSITAERRRPKGILLYEGIEDFENITLSPDGIVQIGKSEEAAAQLIWDTISQFHAQIRGVDGSFFLEDLNSTNGTYLNEEPLAYKEQRELSSEDIVRFADLRFRFV